MKLYDITKDLAALTEKIAALLDNDTMDTILKEAELAACQQELNALGGTHADKCLNLACAIKNIEAEAEALATEEKKLTLRRKAAERRAEWMRVYLAGNMEPGTNLKDARAVIGWRKSTAVECEVKPEDLPAYLRREVTTVTADKAAIKVSLESGETVKGCSLVTRFNIQIK